MTDTAEATKTIQYKHVEPLELAYGQVIARKDNKPTPVPMKQAIIIADAILSLKKVTDKITLIREELVGFKPDTQEYKDANASFKELLDEDVSVELPVLSGNALEEAGVEVDIDSVVILKFHELITYE